MSRAVRSPSRIDRNFTEGTPPFLVILKGSDAFGSETVIASELGYRSQLGARATTSISFFYNQYDDIRSTVLTPVTILPLYFQNGLQGTTHGFEFTLTYQLKDWWRMFSSYNMLREDIKVKPGQTDFSNALNETADPKWQFSLRSSMDLPKRFSVNTAFRWVGSLTINNNGKPATVPSYAELDGQIAWRFVKDIELSVAGRNLLNAYHVEYGIPGPAQQAIQRSVFVKIAGTF